MTKDQPTPNQRRATETLHRSCVVTAGPGAGKTRVLVERVLNILRQGAADLDQIVAITFTNKAANEMKEKIRRAVMELARSAGESSEARRWHGLKRRIDAAAISTIHGFCATVLRAQPVEAEMDPEFTILDEYTSRVLLYNAAEEIINDLVDERDEIAARLITGYSRRGLIDALVDLYRAARSLGIAAADLEKMTLANVSTTEDYKAALAALEDTIDEIFGRDDLSGKMKEQAQAVREIWTRYRSQAPTEPRLEEAARFDQCLDALDEARPDRRGKIADLAAVLETQIEDLKRIFYDVCGRDTLTALITIMAKIDARYRAARAEQGGVDYEDLQLKLRDLFRTHPWIARLYAAKYRFILVDEFQDTNALQKEILDLLISPPSRNGNESKTPDRRPAPNLFIVGDAKQSIYNFRGAAVEVFAEAAQELEEQGAAAIVLEKNFRSTASLIQFFNEFFSRLMKLGPAHDALKMRQLGHVEFIPSEARRDASPHPPVELIFECGEHVKSVDEGREREAARIAARIAEMVQNGEPLVAESTDEGREKLRPVGYSDIAILFRAMTSTKVYEQALRKRGIPYYVLAGKGFYQREEIQDILSLLRFVENRTDEIALVSALRSPLCGLSDETLYWLRQQAERRPTSGVEHHSLLSSLLDHQQANALSIAQRPLVARAAELLTHLLGRRNRVSIADLIEDILVATNYEAIQATCFDGHQRVANLRKLVELARGFEERGPHFLRDFITFIAQFAEMETRESEAQIESGADDAVQIMTVHKAKGLEFPVVIIPDLARKLRSSVPNPAFDRGLGIGMKVPDQRGFLHDTKLRQRVEQQIQWREFFENQRLLFVAATRAKDYLILAGAASKVAPVANLRHLAEGKSWLEWICTILDISDPQDLSEIYEWTGIRLRISPGGDADAGAGAAVERLVDRFAETRNGEPVPPEALPDLPEPDHLAFESIVRRIEPVVIDPSTNPPSLAVTRLVSFAQCPLKYYYDTVLGLPEPAGYSAPGASAEPSTSGGDLGALTRGNIVHRFCESYDGSEGWEPLLWRLVNEQVATVERGSLDEARERAFAEAEPLVQRYLDSELWREIEPILWGGKSGRVESEVEFVYHTGTMPLRGRIDKLVIRGADRATVIDFKTHRITPEEVPELAGEYELQMRAYALGVRQAMRVEDVRAEFYFLEPNARFEIDPARLDATETAQEINELCKQILTVRHMRDATARPSPSRCRRCQYVSFCPSRAG
jgi:ATP-dependent helicase/nuclease subunit A